MVSKSEVEELLAVLACPEEVLDLEDSEFLPLAQKMHIVVMGMEGEQLSADEQEVLDYIRQCDDILQEELAERGYALVDTKQLLEEDPETVRKMLEDAPLAALVEFRQYLLDTVAKKPEYQRIIPLVDEAIVNQAMSRNGDSVN